MKRLQMFLILLLLAFVPLATPLPAAFAQSSTDDLSKQISDKEAQIAQLQAQLNQSQKQEQTLKSQLNTIDSQTQITQLKIDQTNLEIQKLNREIDDLSGRIDRLSGTVDSISGVLLNRIVQTYKYGQVDVVDLLFSSTDLSQILERFRYIQIAQANDKKVLYQLQATKAAYHDQKQDKQTRQTEAEKLSKQLADYQKQLDQQKKEKNELLTQTQNDEATYQRLLAKAKAQLAGFQRFTQGNASILTNQTSCDDWGCYYNQRDSQWGNVSLNNTSYSIADVGCLVTSMAMIYTHYGHKGVTPLSISSNSDNFSSIAPTYLKYIISADGITSTRARSIIDNELSAGRPVIIGIGSGPDHFVVFRSGSNGNYKMNDPFIPNGHDITFTDHYSLSSIKEIDSVTFKNTK